MKLYKFVRDGTDQGDYHYEEVSPPDLKTMNLAALGVLGELKKHIGRGKKNCDRANEPCVYSLYAVLENIIKALESAADLGAVQLIQAKAKAWDELYKETKLNKDDAPIGPIEILQSCDEILTQARAELEKGDKTNG